MHPKKQSHRVPLGQSGYPKALWKIWWAKPGSNWALDFGYRVSNLKYLPWRAAAATLALLDDPIGEEPARFACRE